jgi:transcriptional regulator with XRE-family HTH domain
MMTENVSRGVADERRTMREWRTRRALSLRELARASGLAYRGVVLLENGRRRPRPSTRRKIAEALGVEPWQVIFPADLEGNAPEDY